MQEARNGNSLTPAGTFGCKQVSFLSHQTTAHTCQSAVRIWAPAASLSVAPVHKIPAAQSIHKHNTATLAQHNCGDSSCCRQQAATLHAHTHHSSSHERYQVHRKRNSAWRQGCGMDADLNQALLGFPKQTTAPASAALTLASTAPSVGMHVTAWGPRNPLAGAPAMTPNTPAPPAQLRQHTAVESQPLHLLIGIGKQTKPQCTHVLAHHLTDYLLLLTPKIINQCCNGQHCTTKLP